MHELCITQLWNNNLESKVFLKSVAAAQYLFNGVLNLLVHFLTTFTVFFRFVFFAVTQIWALKLNVF